MAIYDEERRGTSQSILGSLLNPITQMKYQYLSAWAFPTYYQMMAKGSVTFAPMYFMGQLTGLTGKVAPFTAKRTIGGALFKLWESPGLPSVAEKISTAMGGGAEVKTNVLKGLQKFTAQNRFKSVNKARLLTDIRKFLTFKGGIGAKGPIAAGVQKAITSSAGALQTSVTVSSIGAVLHPIAVGVLAGTAVAHLTGLAFKGAVAAINYVDAEIEHMRALELGGTLGPGFRSGAAATERQRAIQALQRTPLAGRRFLGQEASMYSTLI